MSIALDGANGVTFPSGGTQNAAVVAWVNFNGNSGATIRASYNVNSVTRNGTGDYTINFTTALADTNYCLVGTVNPVTYDRGFVTIPTTNLTYSTTQVRVRVSAFNGTSFVDNDANIFNAVVLR